MREEARESSSPAGNQGGCGVTGRRVWQAGAVRAKWEEHGTNITRRLRGPGPAQT